MEERQQDLEIESAHVAHVKDDLLVDSRYKWAPCLLTERIGSGPKVLSFSWNLPLRQTG